MTTSPQQRIESEVKAALKSGDKDRLQTLRLLLTDLKNERIRLGAEVDEATFLVLVRRGIKRREEAAEQYQLGKREELAAKERAEAAILAAYLPAQADEATIHQAIAELVAARGLSGPSAMGQVMKEMRARFGDSADGATINRIARQVLAATPQG